MDVNLIRSNWSTVECDALFVPVFEEDLAGGALASEIDSALDGLLTEVKESGELTGKPGETVTVYRPGNLKCRRLVLVGSGKESSYDSASIRSILMRAVVKTRTSSLKTLAVYRRSFEKAPVAAQAALEGLILGSWNSAMHKTLSHRVRRLEKVLLVFNGQPMDDSFLHEVEHRAEVMAGATNLARAWADEPGNIVNPSQLAERARELANKAGLEIEVWDEQRIEKEGMNAILAVAKGSDEPARLIILRHWGAPDAESPPGVLVGKGVTFDSGGLSIKPAQNMEEMKSDKAGACAVLAAMRAIAQLEVPQNVVGIVPAAENLPSGRAQRPGDVIRSLSGKTIEVINTDAEGRLLLADALHYALQLNPAFVVDIATLTGACMVALGRLRAGVFSNDSSLVGALLRASNRAGERLWQLPLDDEYRDELKSDIADIRNIGERWGGAISAAKFLEEFALESRWCHIDMAGVARFPEDDVVRGATGFGARTLVELASDPAAYQG
jgi:leucyl aminopeptidase